MLELGIGFEVPSVHSDMDGQGTVGNAEKAALNRVRISHYVFGEFLFTN